MPKPTAIEFFEVTVRCPKEILGDLMSDINKRGLTDVNFNLVTAVKTFKSNAPVNGINSQAFLTEWIKEHPTFKASEATAAFKTDGRTASACYPALGVLVEKGILKKLSPGEYSRTDVKALPAPKKTKAKAAKPAKHTKVIKDVPSAEFALRLMRRAHGRMSSLTMKEHFTKDGRAATGVGPVLRNLIDDKKIKRVGEGMYEIAKPGAKKPTKAKANGHAVEVEVPATPGV